MELEEEAELSQQAGTVKAGKPSKFSIHGRSVTAAHWVVNLSVWLHGLTPSTPQSPCTMASY